MSVRVITGDCRDVLRTLPDESVQCCVTSPPYWGLRDYGVDGQLGLEATPDEFIAQLVEVFREVRRVLRSDGTCWVNVGDSYAGGGGFAPGAPTNQKRMLGEAWGALHHASMERLASREKPAHARRAPSGLKPKDLIGQPWRLAFALQADGWFLRSDIIWCLSGGTRVYARTQKGEAPITIKDLTRLDPATVQLWNGERWTQVLGWSATERSEAESIEIELRTGERIGCTRAHQWPTRRGLVAAGDLVVGDVIDTCRLPDPAKPSAPRFLLDDAVAWFVGLYIAEGSQSAGTIQIASHADDHDRFEKLRALAGAFDGTAARHQTSDHGATISVNSPALLGVLDTYVAGRVARDKHLHPRCWRRDGAFLRGVLGGYLEGDGHFDSYNARWRLGFCENDQLAADLRTISARIGATIRLRRTFHKFAGRRFPGYRGEIRFERSGHPNEKPDGEVVAIRASRARRFWDIGVADEPHTFALASGVLTHNSKPNPMPESVTDRPTKAHEYVFLLTKAARYFYDAEAIRDDAIRAGTRNNAQPQHNEYAMHRVIDVGPRRNARSVWTIATEAFSGAHFATFPTELARRCILAGTSEHGACSECGAPWERMTTTEHVNPGNRTTNGDRSLANREITAGFAVRLEKRVSTTGWRPTCEHPDAERRPCVVLDPFGGAGTTGLVADRLQRDAILIELNPEYAAMARRRIERDAGMFGEVLAAPAAQPEAPRQGDIFA